MIAHVSKYMMLFWKEHIFCVRHHLFYFLCPAKEGTQEPWMNGSMKERPCMLVSGSAKAQSEAQLNYGILEIGQQWC